MKKKFFAIYALAGALVASPVFTSCVDDEESPSVENIRNEKANQLKALAALQTAQAEAAKITANADAAYKAALAAYQDALAEAKKVDAAYQTEMLKQAQEKYAIELETIKAQAEVELLQAQLNLSYYEEQLQNKASQKLQDLYWQYSNAIGNTTYYQQRIIELKKNIAQSEAGLVTAEERAEINIANYENEIAYQNKLIALYEKYEGADIEALETAYAEARIAYDKASDDVKLKKNAKNETETAYQDALYVKKYWDEWNYSTYSILNIWYVEEVGDKALATLKAVRTIQNMGFLGSVDEEEKMITEASGLSYTYYTLNAEHSAANKLTLEQIVKNIENYLRKKAEGETAATGLYLELANLEKDRAAALEADENADVSGYDNSIAYKKANIADEEENLAEAKANLEKFNAAVASFAGDDLAAYDKAIADITALVVAYDKANAEYQAACEAANDARAEYNAAYNLKSQCDAKQEIESCKSNILRYQEWIQNAKNNLSDNEAQIEIMKVELANIEAQLAALQAVADGIKAQIDALLASDEETAE